MCNQRVCLGRFGMQLIQDVHYLHQRRITLIQFDTLHRNPEQLGHEQNNTRSRMYKSAIKGSD